MYVDIRRCLLAIHFVFAFIIGYIPAWGQMPESNTDGAIAVLCPSQFRNSMERWINYRMVQGYKVYLLEEPKNEPLIEKTSSGRIHNIVPSVTPEYIAGRIKELAKTDPTLKYLLIVGDGAPDISSEPTAASRLIPVPHVRAKVVSAYGRGEKEIASDNDYADLDNDHVPELAVGRISVSTSEELDIVIDKIISYEISKDNSFWKRRLNFVAGVGGFSPFLDNIIESTIRYILSEMISESYDLSMTQANWKSPYCPDPEMFRSVTVERLNEGCLFWVYMGHGYHKALDVLRTPGGDYPIFVGGDASYINSRNGLPIAMFCACYTGAFDGPENCLAEELIRQPGGPVAVIASSRVSMPYGMSVFGVELIEQALDGNDHNIGTLFLNAKRKMLIKQKTDKRPIRNMIDSIAWWTDPTSSKLNDQLIDHLHLFHLFGDPLMKIPFPQEMTIACQATVSPGEIIQVTGTSNFDGPIYIELVKPRTRQATSVPERKKFELNEKTRIEYMKTYRVANNRAILYIPSEVVNGQFSIPVKIPDDLEGEYVFRGFGVHDNGVTIGCRAFKVIPSQTANTSKQQSASQTSPPRILPKFVK